LYAVEGKLVTQLGFVDDMDDEELYKLMFELLCNRRVDDAVEVAQLTGMHRLAMLLCQIGSDDDMTELISSQLRLWENQRAESKISPGLLAIYRILGSIDIHISRSLSNVFCRRTYQRELCRI
jgi:hypothetical protein